LANFAQQSAAGASFGSDNYRARNGKVSQLIIVFTIIVRALLERRPVGFKVSYADFEPVSARVNESLVKRFAK
jgi:hypothetical protein